MPLSLLTEDMRLWRDIAIVFGASRKNASMFRTSLDPATHVMDWLVPFVELAQHFGVVATPPR